MLRSVRRAAENKPGGRPRTLGTLLRAHLASFRLGIPRISGPAFVLGSAPGSRLPEGFSKSWSLVTVNASQIIAEKMGAQDPRLTLMRPGILIGDSESDRYKRTLLSGHRTGTLLVVSWKGSLSPLEQGCETFGYRYDLLRNLYDRKLGRVGTQWCGPDLARIGRWEYTISTGMRAILLACFLGADPVVVGGVSFSSSGHAYDDRSALRHHVSGDTAVLTATRARPLPIFTADELFARETGLPLWPQG